MSTSSPEYLSRSPGSIGADFPRLPLYWVKTVNRCDSILRIFRTAQNTAKRHRSGNSPNVVEIPGSACHPVLGLSVPGYTRVPSRAQ
eukprot:2668747-Rhodomonas_salina.1